MYIDESLYLSLLLCVVVIIMFRFSRCSSQRKLSATAENKTTTHEMNKILSRFTKIVSIFFCQSQNSNEFFSLFSFNRKMLQIFVVVVVVCFRVSVAKINSVFMNIIFRPGSASQAHVGRLLETVLTQLRQRYEQLLDDIARCLETADGNATGTRHNDKQRVAADTSRNARRRRRRRWRCAAVVQAVGGEQREHLTRALVRHCAIAVDATANEN